MKYVINLLTTAFVSIPASILGYLWAAFSAGWSLGCFVHEQHEKAAIAKFVKDKK